MRRILSRCGDSLFLRRLHGALTVLWAVTIAPVLLLHLQNSVALVVIISIYANVAGHASAWQSSRIEVKTDEATPDPTD